MSSRWEAEGRASIAHQLARWLLRNGFTHDRVALWTDGQWLAAAQAARIPSAVKRGKVPSAATRGMVIGLVTPSPVHPDYYAGRSPDAETEDDG